MPEKTIQIQLTFLEPYRLVEWCNEDKRKTEKKYLRGQGFARWVKGQNGGGGKPSIAGTLLRSATIKAAEEIISLSGGKWDEINCCNGAFFTEIEKPSLLRKRHTLQWESAGDICNDAANACPLCFLLGRFDTAGKNHKDNRHSNTDYAIHFSNLYPGKEVKTSLAMEDVASQRILNRVDYKTGKAHDYFRLWEVDDENARTFTGKITIRDASPEAEGLLKDALGFVDRLCGSLCTIEIKEMPRLEEHPRNTHSSASSPGKTESHGENAVPTAPGIFQEKEVDAGLPAGKAKEAEKSPSEEIRNNLKDGAKKITQAFKASHKQDANNLEKLRSFADVVRAMRAKRPEILDKLPTGKDAKNHHLWDIDVSGAPLRKFLKDLWHTHKPPGDWRTFCTSLGNELYFQYKEATGGLSSQYRILGETEYYPEGDDGKKAHGNDGSIPLTPHAQGVCEWIFVGDLKAATPFYFGVQPSFGSTLDDKDKKRGKETEKGENEGFGPDVNEQTSFRILLDKKGRYRIPRSLLRGVLRRDLRTAFGGSACNVELGGMNPCECKVCAVMRRITIRDSKSDYAEPPDIRYRIRLNPYTATVDEGALFDMEVGPEGIAFPFVLRYRGEHMPEELSSILHYWMDGKAWLGGSGSTGKGRFQLTDLEVFEWKLSEKEGLELYIKERGRRGEEQEIVKKAHPQGLKLSSLHLLPCVIPYLDYLNPLWTKVSYEIEGSSPLISADTIHALLDENNRDAIMYEKRVMCGNTGEPETIPTIKGETIRGIVRTAVGKRSGGLDIDDHEDCSCHICAIFGNEHEAGKVRFEDLTPVPTVSDQGQCGQAVGANSHSPEQPAPPTDTEVYKKYKHIDHVAIDRFHGGAEDAMKFDTYALAGSPKQPIVLKGRLWIKNDLSKDYRKKIADALADARDGLYPIGGKTGVGYGWVSGFKKIEAPEEFMQLIPEKSAPQPAKPGSYSYSDLPKLKLESGHIYYPHYFLKPGEKVDREQKMIGHEKFHDEYTSVDGKKEKLISGKITCKLTTVTPLIIPDTGDEKGRDNNDTKNCTPASEEIMNAGKTTTGNAHKSYKFFRIHDNIMIPGSEIRGMISSVYEAITNSCFRIFDEKDRLSWRMEAKGLSKKLKKGRITKVKNGADFEVEIYKKSARVPFYDGHVNPFEKLNDNQINGTESATLWVKEWLTKLKVSLSKPKRSDNWRKLKGTFYKNDEDGYHIEFSLRNQSYNVHQNVSIFERDIYSKHTDNTSITFWFNEENIPYFMASLVEPDDKTGWMEKTGYLKVTGPNKVEVEDLQEGKLPYEVHDGIPEDWQQIRVNGLKKEKDGTVTKVFRCSFNGKLYTMSKWCETFFYEKDVSKTVTKEAVLQYQRLIEKYQKNPQASPEVFQSLPTKRTNESLKNGDLVYVILDEKTDVAKEIIPVQISRHIDEESLGFKMPDDNLRQCCGREVLEEGLLKDIGDSLSLLPQLNNLFSIHPNGLCPACRLFGTTSYKGRVRFGFAHLLNEPKWLVSGGNGSGGPLTLPLLERPRPTWSMPSDESKVPGRKFYIHHNGWREVQGQQNSISKAENNRTVEPLAEGNEFTFDVHFENLREWELGLLLYSLELETGMGHKLGMGKPLGFGSVKIDIKRLMTFKITGNNIGWNSSEDAIDNYIYEGFKKLIEWFRNDTDSSVASTEFGVMNEEMIKGLNARLSEIAHIQDMRLLLQIPKGNPIVKYPTLNDKSEGCIPGYVYEKLSKTEVLPHEERIKYLTTACSPWNIFLEGTVKWFDKNKGYGFITRHNDEAIYVHRNSIKDKNLLLKEGQKVRFNIKQGKKGPEADTVEIAQ
jgi:CRISPR-associated protein (TIGR03986 family)